MRFRPIGQRILQTVRVVITLIQIPKTKVWNSSLTHLKQIATTQKRHLNLLEYQSKSLLQDSGVAIQEFCMLDATDKTSLTKFSMYACNPSPPGTWLIIIVAFCISFFLSAWCRCRRVCGESANPGRRPWKGPLWHWLQRRRSHNKKVSKSLRRTNTLFWRNCTPSIQ